MSTPRRVRQEGDGELGCQRPLVPEAVGTRHLSTRGWGGRSKEAEASLGYTSCSPPRARSAEALTPVHVAAAWGCRGALELLLSRGGDPTLRDQVRTLRGTGRREGGPRAPPADRVCAGRAPAPGLGASAATPQLRTRAAGAGQARSNPGTRR